jgi:hypothetical protein
VIFNRVEGLSVFDGVDSEFLFIGLGLFEVAGAVAGGSAALLTDDSSDEFDEVGALHDQTTVALLQDSDVLGDGCGSDEIVACDHANSDSGFVALGDSVGHFLARNIPHSCDAEQSQSCFLHGKDSFFVFEFKVIVGVYLFVGDAKGSEGRLGHLSDVLLHFVVAAFGNHFNSVRLNIIPIVASSQDHF